MCDGCAIVCVCVATIPLFPYLHNFCFLFHTTCHLHMHVSIYGNAPPTAQLHPRPYCGFPKVSPVNTPFGSAIHLIASASLPTTISAVNSDIVAFASRLSYEDYLHQTDHLNLVDSYPQLVTRAARIGYNITKVVYRGYSAPAALQVCVRACVRVCVCVYVCACACVFSRDWTFIILWFI